MPEGHVCECTRCDRWVAFNDERYCFGCEPPLRHCECGCGCIDR